MRKCSARPYEGNDKYIFISYCHRDRAHVFPIIEQLVKDGYRVWYDEGIDPGSEWPEIIARHLNGCLICMAFISENSLNSHNCRREINFALMKKKFFISIMLEPVKMSLGMEMQLSVAQSIFKYNMASDKLFFDKLYEAKELEGCLGNPDSSVTVSRHEDYMDESGAFDKVRDPFSDKWFVNGAEAGGNVVRNSSEEDRRRREEEESRRAAEEAQRKEESRRAAEETQRQEEARRAAEEAQCQKEARRAAEEAQCQEEARRAAEEARRQEESRRAEELHREEAHKAAEEAKRRLEEARRAAEEARRLEEEARRLAEEAKQREEEARKAAEEEERRRHEEEARKAAEEEERRRHEEEARKAAEEEERRCREEEARKAAEEEECRRHEEEARKAAEEDDDGKTIMVDDFSDSNITYMLKREKTNEIIAISKRQFIIGRSESKADYVITDNRSVSRVHATLSVMDEKCYITDNNSLNRTFVNDRVLEPDVPYELKNGDGIKICNERFVYLKD